MGGNTENCIDSSLLWSKDGWQSVCGHISSLMVNMYFPAILRGLTSVRLDRSLPSPEVWNRDIADEG